MLSKNIPVVRRGDNDSYEVRLRPLRNLDDPIQGFAHASAKGGHAPHKMRKTPEYVSVAQIENLYRSLAPEDRRNVIVREGTRKRSLSDMRVKDFDDLVHVVSLDRHRYGRAAKSYIIDVLPDWETLAPSKDHQQTWQLFGHPQPVIVDGEFHHVRPELLISSEVLGLFEGGQIMHNQRLTVLAGFPSNADVIQQIEHMQDQKFGDIQPMVSITAIVNQACDLVRGKTFAAHMLADMRADNDQPSLFQ